VQSPATPLADDASVPPHEGTRWTPLRIGGLVVTVGGAVLLGIGAAYGLEARARWSDRQDACSFNLCTDRGYTLTTEARDAANAATWAFAIGGVATAVGVAIVVLAPRGEGRVSASVSGDLLPGGGGALLRGGF
jgi:hypothetical protein